MATATLQRILEEIATLDAGEQRQLLEQLEALLIPPPDKDQQHKLQQALRAAGLVTEERRPRVTDIPHRQRVAVTGPPVSATLLEERR